MMFFLRWTPCGMTGQQKAYWENLSMMMTPLDYWKNGMDLWLRTAEAQMDMTFRMVSLMPSWEVGLMTARGLSDDRVSLRPSKDGKPVLRSVVGTTPQASARKPALKPVAPVAPVVEAMVEAASDIQSAVSDAAEAQVDAASEIRAAMSDVVEAQIDAVAGLAAPLFGASGEAEPAPTPTEAVVEAVGEVQTAMADAAGAQLDAAARIADAVGEVVGVQAEAVTIATAQAMDIAGSATGEVMAAMAEAAAPYLADPGEIEPFAAQPVEPAAEIEAPVVDVPAVEVPSIETPELDAAAETPAPAASATIKPAPAAAPSRKRRQPANPKLPSALKGGGSAT
jgi:hypothetical protein